MKSYRRFDFFAALLRPVLLPLELRPRELLDADFADERFVLFFAAVFLLAAFFPADLPDDFFAADLRAVPPVRPEDPLLEDLAAFLAEDLRPLLLAAALRLPVLRLPELWLALFLLPPRELFAALLPERPPEVFRAADFAEPLPDDDLRPVPPPEVDLCPAAFAFSGYVSLLKLLCSPSAVCS